MKDDNNNKTVFRNARTLARREWIDSALASVREKMDASTFLPATLESLGHELGHNAVRDPARAQCSDDSSKPRLYLAWSDGQRRSGT